MSERRPREVMDRCAWGGVALLARLVLAWLLFATLVPPTATAQASERYGDIVIDELPGLPDGKIHGYHEYVFKVHNLSATRSYDVRLTAPASPLAGHRSLVETHMVVEPGVQRRLSILQPAVGLLGLDLKVHIDGQLQEKTFPWRSKHPLGTFSGGTFYGTNAYQLRLLFGLRVEEGIFPELNKEIKTGEPLAQWQVLRAGTALQDWSPEPLAYSGYDGIVVRWRTFHEAQPAVAAAIWQYVEVGGALVLLDPPSEFYSQALTPEARRGASDGGAMLAGRTVRLTPFGTELATGEVPELATQFVGLGEVAVSAPSLFVLSQSAMKHLAKMWLVSREPVWLDDNITMAHRQIPVVDSFEIPFRSLFMVILLFSLVAGPLNSWWLKRKKKRLWILWTVPALSLATCLVVVSFAVFGEGVRYHGRSFSFTVLDQENQRATTLSWSGYYSSLATEGLRFSRDSEVIPMGGGTGLRTLRWGAEQEFTSGWLAPRLPSYFFQRRQSHRRERLEIVPGPQGCDVVNGLGANVSILVVADSRGRVYSSGFIGAGDRDPLEATEGLAEGGPDALRRILEKDLVAGIRRVKKNPSDYLQPSTYVAWSLDDPFHDSAFPKVADPEEETVIFGSLPRENCLETLP